MANKAKIKESLIEQLENKHANVEHFSDLIDDYLQFYDIKKRLQADIKKRGVCFTCLSASGNEIEKNNPSVKELIGVNKQMLSILKELELNTKTAVGDKDDEL